MCLCVYIYINIYMSVLHIHMYKSTYVYVIAGQVAGQCHDPLAYIEPYLEGLQGQHADSAAGAGRPVPHEAARLFELIQKLNINKPNVSPFPASQLPGAVGQLPGVMHAPDATRGTAASHLHSTKTPPPDSDAVEQDQEQGGAGHDEACDQGLRHGILGVGELDTCLRVGELRHPVSLQLTAGAKVMAQQCAAHAQGLVKDSRALGAYL